MLCHHLLSHHRLQLSSFKVESEEDHSYAALTCSLQAPSQQWGSLGSDEM
uniref:Uncharacterized protein n=1 Tax=Anguilla anguilla TaxID=7936 RepID=A0A0E9XS70_ANGAN